MSTTLAFLGSIATSVMTLVGVFVGSRLSYGRSIKEKFWDVRREAYSAILSKLAEVDRITKGGDDWIAAQGLKNYDRLVRTGTRLRST